MSQNSYGTLICVSNVVHLSLSSTLINHGFLCTDLPPLLDNGYLGKEMVFYLPLYLQSLAQVLEHKRSSINIYRMNLHFAMN